MISVPRHQLVLHDAAHDVPGRDVHLLDEGRDVARNVDGRPAIWRFSAHPHSTTTWIIRDAPGCSGSRSWNVCAPGLMVQNTG
jgi:hypothetical protein